jgi:hypothetical protein
MIMDWKIGETAISLYDIFTTKADQEKGKYVNKLLIKKGKTYCVLQTRESSSTCPSLIDIGVAFPYSDPVYCICRNCSPSHRILAQKQNERQLFLLGNWFIRPENFTPRVKQLMEENKFSKRNRVKILIGEPLKKIEVNPKEQVIKNFHLL